MKVFKRMRIHIFWGYRVSLAQDMLDLSRFTCRCSWKCPHVNFPLEKSLSNLPVNPFMCQNQLGHGLKNPNMHRILSLLSVGEMREMFLPPLPGSSMNPKWEWGIQESGKINSFWHGREGGFITGKSEPAPKKSAQIAIEHRQDVSVKCEF